MPQTIIFVHDDANPHDGPTPQTVPFFFCTECGDRFAFALLANGPSGRYDDMKLVGTAKEQKPRFCPTCGAKNKLRGDS